MPGTGQDYDASDFDDQDRAEILDETNYDEGTLERRTFEELPEVFDVTRREGDRDDDEALALDAEAFDEDLIDEDSELQEDDELRYRATTEDDDDFYDDARNPNRDTFDEDRLEGPDNIEGLDMVADAGVVTGGEDDVTDFQSKSLSEEDLRRMGYAADAKTADELLDEGLEETFPASDPVAISPDKG
jgi:hypothetical protein